MYLVYDKSCQHILHLHRLSLGKDFHYFREIRYFRQGYDRRIIRVWVCHWSSTAAAVRTGSIN